MSFSDRSSVRLTVRVRLWTFHIFIFFSRATGPILTKLGSNYLWVTKKKDASLFKWRAPSFSRGDNYEIVKKKIFFSRIFFTGSISSKLGTKHAWVKGFMVFQMKGYTFLPGELIVTKIHWHYLKFFFSRTNMGQFQPNMAQGILG